MPIKTSNSKQTFSWMNPKLEIVVGDVKEHASLKNPAFSDSLLEIEKAHIQKVIAYCGYNKTRAAQILGISRLTLREKMKRYGITDK